MNTQEMNLQAIRISKFKKLAAQENDATTALNAIIEGDSTGPNGQGPFTSYTRESRRVDWIEINFSKTEGGSDRVDKRLFNLRISASRLGDFLRNELEQQREKIWKEMREL